VAISPSWTYQNELVRARFDRGQDREFWTHLLLEMFLRHVQDFAGQQTVENLSKLALVSSTVRPLLRLGVEYCS